MKHRNSIKTSNENSPNYRHDDVDDQNDTEQTSLLSSGSSSTYAKRHSRSRRKSSAGKQNNNADIDERQSLLRQQQHGSTNEKRSRDSFRSPESASSAVYSSSLPATVNEEETTDSRRLRTTTSPVITTNESSGENEDPSDDDDVELFVNRPRVGSKVSRTCDAYYDSKRNVQNAFKLLTFKFQLCLRLSSLTACMRRCQCLCPLVYRILRSPPTRYKTTKLAFGMPVGFAFGLVYYHLIIDRMQLGSNYLRYMLGTIMTLGLAAGYGMSVHVRALTWLVIPNMFGRGGRTVLLTLTVSALINGPIAHIVTNLKESVRSVTCSAEVSMELAKKRFELMSKPIHEVLKDFAEQSLKLHNISERIHEAFAPMETEVGGQRETQQLEQKFRRIDSEVGIDRTKLIEDKTKVDEPKTVPSSDIGQQQSSVANKKSRGTFLQMMYQRKLDLRCGDIFNSAIDACKAELGRAYRDCMGHLSIIGYLFCWPCKLGVLCNVIKCT